MSVARQSLWIRVRLAGSQPWRKRVLVLHTEHREHHDSLLSVQQSFEPRKGIWRVEPNSVGHLNRSRLRKIQYLPHSCGNYVGYPTLAMAEPAPAPLPRWRVDCKTCLESFTHSPVGKSRRLEDYLHPTEPEFPSGGLELTCPRCKITATYQASDIRYYLK